MKLALDKDMIRTEMLPHLSQARRGYACKADLAEVALAIFYKLEADVRWTNLPVDPLVHSASLSWNAVYHHFRKWSRDGSFKRLYVSVMK